MDSAQPQPALHAARRTYAFRYASAAHSVEVFRTYYRPVNRTFAALPPEGQAALERELLAPLHRRDGGGGRGLVVDGECLEAVITVQ